MGCGASQLVAEEPVNTTTASTVSIPVANSSSPIQTATTTPNPQVDRNITKVNNSNKTTIKKCNSVSGEENPNANVDVDKNTNDINFNKIVNDVTVDFKNDKFLRENIKEDSCLTIIAPSAEDFIIKDYANESSIFLSKAVDSIGFNPVVVTSCNKVTIPLKPIAFEIPLDNKGKNLQRARPPTRMLLPQLGLPVKTTANSKNSKNAHLKVDLYLNKLLDDSFDKPNPFQPFVSKASSLGLNGKFEKYHESSSLELRKKLLEKEAQAAKNRQKEIEKLQSKLARQEQHAKLIRERKKLLKLNGVENSVNNEEENIVTNLEKRGGAGFRSSKTIISNNAIKMNSSGKEVINDNDSGVGSRTGSGRSDSRPHTSVLDVVAI
ncbi:hypothetical protein HDU92_001776 [Lobulomyces angularis]|nr:hypothetical protein HDU92_001776 [Lobulomyces angularis]